MVKQANISVVRKGIWQVTRNRETTKTIIHMNCPTGLSMVTCEAKSKHFKYVESLSHFMFTPSVLVQ